MEYSDNLLKASGILWRYCRDEPVVDGNGAFVDFTPNNPDTKSFNLKVKLTGQTGKDATKNLNIMVPLKYLGNF